MRPAIVLLLLVAAASCTTERQYSSYGMSVTYSGAAGQPAPLDPARTVAEQDCTRPIALDRGNLRCR
jgi:hypothetical protein